MNGDFDSRFNKRMKDFDKSFDRAQKWFWVGWIFTLGLILASIGFVVWVTIALLRFFGVV